MHLFSPRFHARLISEFQIRVLAFAMIPPSRVLQTQSLAERPDLPPLAKPADVTAWTVS